MSSTPTAEKRNTPDRFWSRVHDVAAAAGLLDAVPATDLNPRRIAVYHREDEPAPHYCTANLFVRCATCEQPFVLCQIPPTEFTSITDETWRCSGCADE